MARVPLPIYVADPATGNAVAGAVVHITRRDGGADATLYAGETGAGTVANPTVTDAYGRALVWVDRHPLKLDYSGAGLAAWTEYRDPAPASDASVDAAWLAAGVGGGGGGLAKVVAFPAAPADGDAVIRTDLNGSPIFTYSTENGWEQVPRMGAVTVPSVRAYASAVQAVLTNTTLNPVLFDTEIWDTDAIHPGANAGEFVVKTPGRYQIDTGLELSAGPSATGQGLLTLTKNGVPLADAFMVGGIGGISEQLLAASGDVFRLTFTNNNTGATQTIGAGERNAHFAMTWLGGPGQTVDERGVPAASASLTATQAIPTGGAEVLVALGGEDFDTDGMHDPAANNSRLTVKTPGLYVVRATADWAVNGTGTRRVYIGKNAGGVFSGAVEVARDSRPTGPYGQGQTAIAVLNLAAGDYVEMFVYQESGGALNLQTGLTRLSATMVGSGKTVTPFARVRNSVAQSIPNGADTVFGFDAEDADNDGIHDPVTNNTRLTARTAGTYAIVGSVEWGANGAGLRYLRLYKNGVMERQSIAAAIGGGDYSPQEIVAELELAVGDYLELHGAQTSGGALNVGGAGPQPPKLAMVKVGSPAAPAVAMGPVNAEVYTLATLPAAAAVPAGRVVLVSDGAAGQQARMSTGLAWINLG